MKKIICVIPARLESTRFPKKVLAYLREKPLLEWVWRAALACDCFSEVVFAVDAQETFDLVSSFGGKAFYTSLSCQNGTERMIELYETGKIQGDIFVNWQADEPFISPSMIRSLLQTIDSSKASIWTLRKKIRHSFEKKNPNVVKVVTNKDGVALYFSRSPIPFAKINKEIDMYKHIGIYAFTTTALNNIKNLSLADLEESEQLEQLRFLFHGLTIEVHETKEETIGIDTLEDLFLAEKFLQSNRFFPFAKSSLKSPG